jgi:glycosyltransferase involved in cell wall biosynthesis
VAGDAALLVDPMSVHGLAGAIRQALENGDLRADLRERGFRRAAELTWDRAARETLAVYQAVLATDGR